MKYAISNYSGINKRKFHLMYDPLCLSIIITSRCNLKCKFCKAASGLALKSDDLPFTLYLEILKRFKNSFIIMLGGGEPFLHEDILRMIRHGRMCKLKVNLNTNGTLITDKIDRIIDSNPSLLRISLNAWNSNGYAKLTGASASTFEKVLENIERLVDKRNKQNKKVVLGVSFVCTKENYRKIPDMVKLAQQLRVDQVSLLNVMPVSKHFTEDHCLYDDYEDAVQIVQSLNEFRSKIKIFGPELHKKNPASRTLCCIQPFTRLTISTNGDSYTCCNCMTYAGNILNNSVWNNPIFKYARRSMVDDTLPLPKSCKTCLNYNI